MDEERTAAIEATADISMEGQVVSRHDIEAILKRLDDPTDRFPSSVNRHSDADDHTRTIRHTAAHGHASVDTYPNVNDHAHKPSGRHGAK